MRYAWELVVVLLVIVVVWGDVFVGRELSKEEVDFVVRAVNEAIRDYSFTQLQYWKEGKIEEREGELGERYVLFSRRTKTTDWVSVVAGIVNVYQYGEVDVIAHHALGRGEEEIEVYLKGRKVGEISVWEGGVFVRGKDRAFREVKNRVKNCWFWRDRDGK